MKEFNGLRKYMIKERRYTGMIFRMEKVNRT